MNEYYQKQVRLLLDILPELVKLPQFALKGGTALNFFWHNMPRLSVDIDLVYLPAVQWKLHNIRKMSTEKHNKELDKLKLAIEYS